MKNLIVALSIAVGCLSFSACDIIRGAINNGGNTTVYRCVPMTQGEFSNAFNLVSGRTFDNDKLATAKQVTSKGQCLTAQQIKQICALLEYENSRLEYAKYAYPFCADQNNYGIMNDLFKFDSSKRELGALTGVN